MTVQITHGYSYRERLQTLQYDFLRGNLEKAVATALRFTLSAPGVDIAIVGTSNRDNLRRNVEAAAQGPLPQEQYDAIRAVWEERADQHWLGLL